MKRPLPPRKEFDPAKNLLETELGNGWMVIERFEMQSGRRIVAELTVCPAPPNKPIRKGRHLGDRPEDARVPEGGITARLLRTVKVGKHAEPVIADYRRWVKRWFGADALRRLDLHTGVPSTRRRKRKTRSSRAGELFYAEVARDYEALWKQGAKAPTAELAELRGVDLASMRSHVHLARVNGFLTETSRGKAGGELTSRGRAVLSANTEAKGRQRHG